MFGWWKRRREDRERIEREAREYLLRHGDLAYGMARERAIEAMRLRDWDENRRWTLIRARIRLLMGLPPHVDTATRYEIDNLTRGRAPARQS
jgi:hypothetical protein